MSFVNVGTLGCTHTGTTLPPASALPATEFFSAPAAEAPLDGWITLTPAQVSAVFTHDPATGGINAAADAAFALTVVLQLTTSESFNDADVLFRVVSRQGVLAAGSQRLAASETPLVTFHDVFLASKDLQFFVQVRPEVNVTIESVQMRLGAIRTPAMSSFLQVLRSPFDESLDTPPLGGDIIVLPQSLGAAKHITEMMAQTHGTDLSIAGNRVVLPRPGRLYRVIGDVPKATKLRIDIYDNGYNTSEWPQNLDAPITKTGGKFNGKTGGAPQAPGMIYTQTTTAKLGIEVGGKSDTTGGRITLTDVTPYDYIGSTIHFDKVEATIHANRQLNVATSKAPIITMSNPPDHKGRVFLLSKLPVGAYKVSGEIRVTGPHTEFQVMTGYTSWYADQIQPMMKRTEGNDTVYTVLFYLNKKGTQYADIEALHFGLVGTPGTTVTIDGELEVRRMEFAVAPGTWEPLGDPFPGYTLTVPRQTITKGYLTGLSVKEARNCLPPFILGKDNPADWVGISPSPWHGYRESGDGAMWDSGTSAQTQQIAPWRWQINLYSFNGGLTKLELHHRNRTKTETASTLVKGDANDWHIGPVEDRNGETFYEGLLPFTDGIGGFDFGLVFIAGTNGVEVEGEIIAKQVNGWPGI